MQSVGTHENAISLFNCDFKFIIGPPHALQLLLWLLLLVMPLALVVLLFQVNRVACS